jgi:hypothetical protein
MGNIDLAAATRGQRASLCTALYEPWGEGKLDWSGRLSASAPQATSRLDCAAELDIVAFILPRPENNAQPGLFSHATGAVSLSSAFVPNTDLNRPVSGEGAG